MSGVSGFGPYGDNVWPTLVYTGNNIVEEGMPPTPQQPKQTNKHASRLPKIAGANTDNAAAMPDVRRSLFP